MSDQQTEWTLTADQLAFMRGRHMVVEIAYASEDMELLRRIAATDEYRALFGTMTWDEAYDRYEMWMLGENTDG